MLLKKVCTGPRRSRGVPISLLGASLCLTAAMSYGTITQSSYFKNNLAFYAYILTKAPHNPYAETNYATLLAESGQYDHALEEFVDAVKYNPTYWTLRYDLGLTYYKIGKNPEAETSFLRAIRVNPHNPDQYFYLGMTRFKAGRTAEAIPCVRQAIAIRPKGFAYHFALGIMLRTQGNVAGALQEFKLELLNYPDEQRAAAQVVELEKHR
jgi:tetratricopeptide (TPR) repeat protein